ncbi:LOW QUALITY PROTEIN: coiled-coil domain-containing protein 187 [Talpa occidentalis]|uniref:LOW QUALITY PROTEIN: coiled-coil domain-containing protein 187 n=1 Tax=Talpa occidentalis TaxID=50954 RepID=UPI0023F82F31|nr:LOW QUALITY PROTEIN: coiled-coil domain-containing protein 187 [Talpa occidentalis]
MWSAGEESGDRGSSVSSGRLSGSSGGHELSSPAHTPWKERPPQVQGPQRQPRESSPRLERLLDKIRAQAQGQASCASLATSTPCGASLFGRTSRPAPHRKARRPAAAPQPRPALVSGGPLGRYGRRAAERGPEDQAPPAQGHEPPRVPQRQASVPREKPRRMKSSSCKREKPSKPPARRATKDKDSESVGVYAWRTGRARARELLGPPCPAQAPERGAVEGPGPRPGTRRRQEEQKCGEPPLRPQIPSPAPVRHDHQQVSAHTPSLAEPPATVQAAVDILRDLRQQIQAGLELSRGGHPRGGLEPGPKEQAGRRLQGCWSAPHAQDPFLAGTGSPPSGRRQSLPAGQESRLEGQGPPSPRPGSPPARRSPFPQRPWSASAAAEDWEGPARRPWSASFTQGPGPRARARGSPPPPSRAKDGWRGPSPRGPWAAPGKEDEEPPVRPCPKPRGWLGRPYSPECLRAFMRQKAAARRRQALQEKAAAVRALELKNQRLRDVYEEQRAAVLRQPLPLPGGAGPVVSQMTPSIVTFVPHSLQTGGQEAPGSPGGPVLAWSKVTSGMVLGDQEAPGSFCLCLNRAPSHTQTPDPRGSQDDWAGAARVLSPGSSGGPLRLRDLSTRPLHPGLCIYLAPEEAERLGMAGPLHFRYKQARVQALETMANMLKQRIDVLTAKLQGSEVLDGPSDSDPAPLLPGAVPAAPAGGAALVPSGGPMDAPSSSLDGERPWGADWDRRQSMSPRDHGTRRPQGFTEDGRSEPEERLERSTTSSQALGAVPGGLSPCCPGGSRVCLRVPSSHWAPVMGDPTGGSLRLEEMQPAPGPSPVMPWTVQHFGAEAGAGARASEPLAVSAGQREQGQPPPGALADVLQKPLSFLEALKLDPQVQERALALLRLRAEREVWAAEKALEELLFQHQLERLMQTQPAQAGREPASGQEQLPQGGDPAPRTFASSETAGPRPLPPLGGHAASPPRGPAGAQGRQAGTSASRELVQEGRPDQESPLRQPYPWDNPTLQMLQQSLREERLRVQHQAALLRLRERALEEKMRAELAWLEHRRRFLTEWQDRAPPRATSPADGQLWPLRSGEHTPADRGWPEAQGQGDPRTSPSATEETRVPKGKVAYAPPGGAGPQGPREAGHSLQVGEGSESQEVSGLGLDVACSPRGKPPEVDGPRPGGQRRETCWQEDPCGPSRRHAAQLPTAPAPAAAGEVPPTHAEGSPPPALVAPVGLGCESECSGRWGASPAGSDSSASWASLPEFQRASAILVQLSQSSSSLSGGEAGDTPEVAPGWPGEFSALDSQGLHGGGGQGTWERSEGRGACPLQGPTTGTGAPEPPPGPQSPPPRPGSDLSEASREVWDEENLPGPGASGPSSASGGKSDPENWGPPPSWGPAEGQEASGASGSLTGGPGTRTARQKAPETAGPAAPPRAPSCSDGHLTPARPSGALASEGPDAGKAETQAVWALAGRLLAPRSTVQGPPTDGNLLRVSPEPEDPGNLWAPPGDPSSLAACGPAPGRASADPRPGLAGGILPKILSPVDKALSSPRAAPFPPPPPSPPAESEAEAYPLPEDIPPPPADAVLSPGVPPGSPGEDTSAGTEVPSWSEDVLPEAPSPAPPELGLGLGAAGRGRHLEEETGESSSGGQTETVGGQWTESLGWPGSPWGGGADDALGGLPRVSTVARVAGAGLATGVVAGDPLPSGSEGGHPAPGLGPGPQAGLLGVGTAEAADVVSTRLTRRILCDTRAVFSERAQPGSPLTGELVGTSWVPEAPATPAGLSWRGQEA